VLTNRIDGIALTFFKRNSKGFGVTRLKGIAGGLSPDLDLSKNTT
jgi:hypothetical protein